MGRIGLLLMCLFSMGIHAQKDTLRVMTFNILHGATVKNDFNLDTLAGVIKAYNPHLVALQEVDFKTKRAKGYDLPTELGHRTKMASLFARAMYFDGGEYGEGVLSKFSFVSTESISLPHLPNSEPRAALAVRIKTANGNIIQFVGTHLDHQKEEKDRIMQARAIVEQFGETIYPTLLLGDLNAEPDSETMSIISSTFTTPDHSGARMMTYPSTGPKKKIDYVLFNQPEHWEVVDYEVLCENYASDHCIAVSTLVFTP